MLLASLQEEDLASRTQHVPTPSRNVEVDEDEDMWDIVREMEQQQEVAAQSKPNGVVNGTDKPPETTTAMEEESEDDLYIN